MIGFWLRPWARALLVAFALLVAAYLMLPTVVVAPMSFSDSDFLRFPPTSYSLRWWQSFLSSPAWTRAVGVSLMVAVLTALVAVPVALAAAYGARRLPPRWEAAASVLILAPAVVPAILIAMGLFFVYARLGLNGTLAGLVVGHVLVAVPVAFVVLRAALADFDFDQERAALSLGASRARAFAAVVLPQIRASVGAGLLLAFLVSLDEVIIAMFVSGGATTTANKLMFLALRDAVDPQTAVISTLWSTLVLLATVVVLRREFFGRPVR